MSHNARVTNTKKSRQERRHASLRARRPQPLFLFAAQARKLSLSASLAWAEGAPKCYPPNSDGGAAIEILSISSVSGLSLGSRVFGRSCGLQNCDCDRHELFLGAPAGVRYAMSRRGRGWCPGCHSLRFTILRISLGRRRRSNRRRIASGALAQCEHATSSWINSNSIQSNSKEVFLDFFFNWIESNSPRSTMKMPSWLFIFFFLR